MKIFGTVLPEKARLLATVKAVASGRGGSGLNITLILVAAGLYGVGAIVIRGHGATTSTGDLAPWGLQIATYLYFALVSGGCTFVHFFAERCYPEKYAPLAAKVVFAGLVTALAGFLSLASEMGHPERLYYFLLSPNLASPMFWMSVCYSVYLVMKSVEFYFIQTGRHSTAVSRGTFLVAIVTYCTLGALLGTVSSRTYYYSALMPLHFLFLGATSGGALVMLLAATTAPKTCGSDREQLQPFVTFLRIGLAVTLLTTIIRALTGLSSTQEGSAIFRITLANDLGFGAFAALILPLLLLVKKGRGWLTFTALYILITQLKVRNDLVSGGFRLPVFRASDTPELISYTPSIHELLVVVASISLTMAIYILCDRAGQFEAKGRSDQ